MRKLSLPRLDISPEVRKLLLPHCRLEPGQIWEDPEGKHRVGCLDAARVPDVSILMGGSKATLAIQDPPYNLVAFEERSVEQYIVWCEQWVANTSASLAENASLYVWLGADQACGFQPLPDFMVMMRHFKQFRARSFIDQYYELRDEYIARNMYLYIFEISAPRTFGEAWAQGHLKELVPELEKPTKKLDPDYSGQYDFCLDGRIRVEVKASRAVDFDSADPLYVKALSSDSDRSFDMNFQQTKPSCCDVFVWIGVWRDRIRYRVLTSNDVAGSKYFSDRQHRGNGGEGQLHLTRENIDEFKPYEVEGRQLLQAIREAYKRQTGGKRP